MHWTISNKGETINWAPNLIVGNGHEERPTTKVRVAQGVVHNSRWRPGWAAHRVRDILEAVNIIHGLHGKLNVGVILELESFFGSMHGSHEAVQELRVRCRYH